MKKAMIWCLLLCGVYAWGASLPLSPQGRNEAELYMDFLRGALAEGKQEGVPCASYKRALSRAPENKVLRRLLTACALAGDHPEEADQYAGYIEDGENDGEDLAVYAFYKWRRGDLNAAQDYYEQALAAAPDDLRILYQYVLLMSYIDVDQAVAKLQRLKTDYPSMAHVVDYETGNLYLRKKDVQKALHYYDLSTQAEPDYPQPYLARAQLYEKASQFFFMLRELERLEQTGYESAAMYSKLGSAYVLVKDEEKAKRSFSRAKELDSSDKTAGYFLALFAEGEKDYASAARYLRETADFQTDAGKWLQTAFYEQQGGDGAAALRTLEEGRKRFPKNVELGYFYALALQDENQCRRAAGVLEEVLESNPDYENARLAYAFALECAGKYKKMERQLLLLTEKDPDNAAAYNLWGFSLAERGVRLDEAQEYITRALALKPGDRSFADSLAWTYYQKGDYARALELLESLDEEFVQSNADVAWHLGAVYFALGRTEDARPLLERAAPEIKQAKKLLKKLPPPPSAVAQRE